MVLAVPLAAGVLAGVGVVLSPTVGAVLMPVSTVVVAWLVADGGLGGCVVRSGSRGWNNSVIVVLVQRDLDRRRSART